MKKYIFLFCTLVSLTFTTSCDQDNLELLPFNSVVEETALLTIADFENATNGLYWHMIQSTYYGADFMSFPDVLSDNLIINLDARQTQRAIFEWRYNPITTRAGFMSRSYRVAQQANFILENLSVLPDSPEKDNVEAQALAARALTHFHNCNLFGMIPTQGAYPGQSSTANAALGTSLNFTSDVREEIARSTVEDVYASVIDDLEEAKGKISASNDIGRFNLESINALLSRVYLYNGQWQAAINAANEVTTPVTSFSDFAGLWNDSNDGGVLFKLINRDADTDISTGVPYSQTLTGGIFSEYVVDFGLNNLYATQDVRRGAYIDTSPFDGGPEMNHVAKWLESSINAGSGVLDIKVVRAAEVQLNKAEALANMGMDGPALAALDLVRSERYVAIPGGGETGDALKEAIQLERRLELAFEGHRFFDIKRQGLPIQRTNAGEFADGTGTPPFELTLPAGDCRFELPIPQAEINVNSNSQQNPCYQ